VNNGKAARQLQEGLFDLADCGAAEPVLMALLHHSDIRCNRTGCIIVRLDASG